MDIFSLNELGINININSLSVNINDLRKNILHEDVKGFLVNVNKEKRCLIEYIKEYYRGGYGKLYLVKRTTSISEFCLVKIPIYKDSDLLTEAILQFMSYKTLEGLKLEYMLAKIYDVYTKNSIVHFSMELKNGIFFKEFIEESKNPERDFIDSFIQICIALYYLEKLLCLDHRDLHYTNLLIIKKPTKIDIRINDKHYMLNTDFHICILDFGFACTGLNTTCINASDKTFNINTICMKPGRDIFQLLASIWCIKEIRNKMSSRFCDLINSFYKYNEYDYSVLLKDETKASWSYIITNKNNFVFPPLVPENLLETLYQLKESF
jgi:serine/threonine protein kinase